jgi:hypothetical protein
MRWVIQSGYFELPEVSSVPMADITSRADEVLAAPTLTSCASRATSRCRGDAPSEMRPQAVRAVFRTTSPEKKGAFAHCLAFPVSFLTVVVVFQKVKCPFCPFCPFVLFYMSSFFVYWIIGNILEYIISC